ncbi:glycosyltransferase 61 family protein [Maioricimonas rarisocia]|nr:glycosyltransferase family 61 protein [Maioricimonas rarisocia]
MKIRRKAVHHACLFLEPENVTEHYYHFLFDLCLPLWRLTEVVPLGTRFTLRSFGILTDRLEAMFPGSVCIEDDPDRIEQLPRMPLSGMNPRFVELDCYEVMRFRRHVLSTLGANETSERMNVLLIERAPPDPYFLLEAQKRGAGASRRSIPNHSELAAAVESLVQPPYQFRNVRLEECTLREQVELFANAAVVIGQHGAGLANSLWMRPGSEIVELSNCPELTHFPEIARVMRHRHSVYRTDGPHAEVDVGHFLDYLKEASPSRGFQGEIWRGHPALSPSSGPGQRPHGIAG